MKAPRRFRTLAKRSARRRAEPLLADRPEHATIIPHHERIDVWLQRLSHASQVVLLLFTVGTIYFTVLPLYQKALLEEAIARKEVELKQVSSSLGTVTKQLQDAYAQVRRLAAREYVAYAGAECSGLLEPLRPPLSLRDRAAGAMNLEDKIFMQDATKCLMKAMDQASSLRLLRSEDRDFFSKKVIELGNDLRAAKVRLQGQHGTMKAADAFLLELRTEVLRLRSLQWPDYPALATEP